MPTTKSLISDILERYDGIIERVELCALLGISPSYLSLLIDGKRDPSPPLRDKMMRLIEDPKGLLKDWIKEMERKISRAE